MPLAGQVHICWRCDRRLPIDNVDGSAVAICPKCKAVNRIIVPSASPIVRERMS